MVGLDRRPHRDCGFGSTGLVSTRAELRESGIDAGDDGGNVIDRCSRTLKTRSIDRDLIVPYYQPKIDLLTVRITGLAALLRWNHPGRGVQTPASIAAAFEDTALAIALGERMQAKMLADVRTWLDGNVGFGRIAMNASAGAHAA